MPLFSIIIPTYNRADFLVDALNSVRGQSFDDYEAIVVDDGSTDHTSATLARCAEDWKGGPLKLFRQENAGQGTARNFGISKACGEYCLFLDSDDLLFPWSLSTVASTIAQAHSPPLVLATQLRFRDPAEYAAAQFRPLRFTIWPDLLHFSQNRIAAGAGETIARTELLREVGGFLTDRMIGEDTDLLLRCGVATPMVSIEAPVTYAYRMHDQMFTIGASAYLGACAMIARCAGGVYPGGIARQREVERYIAKIGKYHGLRYLIAGDWRKYISLYFKTFTWQLRSGHYEWLLKMPTRLLFGMLGTWPVLPRKRRAARDSLLNQG